MVHEILRIFLNNQLTISRLILLRYQLIDSPCLLKTGRIFHLKSIIKLFEVVGKITFVNDLLDQLNPKRVDIIQDNYRL